MKMKIVQGLAYMTHSSILLTIAKSAQGNVCYFLIQCLNFEILEKMISGFKSFKSDHYAKLLVHIFNPLGPLMS